METPFFGGFSTGLSPNLSDGACVNLYPEVVETKDGKRIGGLYSTPGLKKWASVGSGPIRGLHNAWGQSKLITVSGNTVYSIDVNGAQTSLGTLTTIAGPVSILSNEDQVFVCDGVAGMVYSGGTWTNTGLLRPGVAVSQDTFGLANSVGTNQIFQSNAGDLSIWDPLSYTTADSTPSPVIGMAELFRQVWAFKTDAAEIYNDVGSSGFAFARMQGAYLQIGCIAPYSVAAGEHQILWLGQNDNGTACVYTTNGYQAVPCSYHALDYALSQYRVISDAVGFVYKQGGHEFYVLSFPTAGSTWIYDTGLKLWHQRGEYVNGSYLLHDGQSHAQWLGMNLVGSSGQGVIYKYDLGYATDDIANPGTNNPKRWMRRWRALQRPVTVPMRFPPLQIDIATTTTQSSASIIISGSLGPQLLNEPVSFKYQVISPYRITNVKITSGSLPPGLSMDSTGYITGTPSATGSYSWTVKATDTSGATASLNDSSSISFSAYGNWALVSASTLYIGTSPSSFPYSTALSNPVSGTQASFVRCSCDGQNLFTPVPGNTQADVMPVRAYESPINNVIRSIGVSGSGFVSISGITFQTLDSGVVRTQYAYSSDGGSTWNTVTSPGSLASIVRLRSSRWVAIFVNGATQLGAYSDQEIPTVWTTGIAFSGTVGWSLAYDGTTAMCLGNGGIMYTTTDGKTWTTGTYPDTAVYQAVAGLAAGPTGVFVGAASVAGTLYRTLNSGQTWTKVTTPATDTYTKVLGFANGVFFAGYNVGDLLITSVDSGNTWQASTLPSAYSGTPLLAYCGASS